MIPKLFLLFTLVPMIEIALLVKIGTVIGFWPTMLMIVGTGLAGAVLARLEGLRIWRKVREELREGRMPAERLIDALLVLAAGLALITPGLLSDTAGLAMLIPWTRNRFKRWLKSRFKKMIGIPGSRPIHFS